MNSQSPLPKPISDFAQPQDAESVEPVGYDFGLNRRDFIQRFGAGLLLVLSATPALAQRRGGGSGGSKSVAARIHLGTDGAITVFTGKVEGGQGARAELTEAAAEELRVSVGQIRLVMADTDLVPDDGITAGSRSTPSTVPAIRQGAAAARRLLVEFASKRWNVAAETVQVREGKAIHGSDQPLGYADLAADTEAAKTLQQAVPANLTLTPVKEWKVLGQPTPRPNGRDIVTGAHKYPSDQTRPGMLYGKVLRAPAYGAKLVSVDLAPAKALKGVVAFQDEQFVGVAAPTTIQAQQALEVIAATARWERSTQPSHAEVYDYLKQHAQGGVLANPFAEELAQAKHALRQEYHVAYVQHAPLEPRAALAEWTEDKLTVWAGNPEPLRTPVGVGARVSPFRRSRARHRSRFWQWFWRQTHR